jgi:hypothetical protein
MPSIRWIGLASRRHMLIAVAAFAVAGIAGCGGGGGDDSPPAEPGPSKVFVADSGSAVVVSTANDNPSPGTFALDRTISGPAVSNTMPDLAYDFVSDRLYILNNSAITVVDSAGTASGSTTPSRSISSASFVSTPQVVALDAARDLLYVADASADLLVFGSISTANGPTSPARTLSVSRPAGGSVTGVDRLFVDATRDILYAKGHVGGAGGVSQVILVYDNASTRTGAVMADRELTFATATILGIAGDGAGDRLFVADVSGGVMVFDGASTLSGAVTANRTINMPTFVQKTKLAPAGDRLYGISSNSLGVYIVNNASTANGAVPVTLATSPGAALLTAIAVAQ